MTTERKTGANRRLTNKWVQCLYEVLCFVSSSVVKIPPIAKRQTASTHFKDMKINLFFILFLILTLTAKGQKSYLWFSDEVGTTQTCAGQEVEMIVDITTATKTVVKLYEFNIDKGDFKLYYGDKEIKPSDTLVLKNKEIVEVKIRYKIQDIERPQRFNFKSNLDEYSDNSIKLLYGQFLFTTNNIQKNKHQDIDISNSCADSLTLYFPYGGTISSATLYSDSSSTKKELKSVTYGYGTDNNYIKLAKSDIGRYFVSFGSCHWGGDFWLTVK